LAAKSLQIAGIFAPHPHPPAALGWPRVRVLPIAASCALDADGLSAQRERYHEVGSHARLLERDPRHLVVELDAAVDAMLVAETVAVERECCPFFDLAWEPTVRRLTVAVSLAEHEPALDAIAHALELAPEVDGESEDA
jgi:hypothetical protein